MKNRKQMISKIKKLMFKSPENDFIIEYLDSFSDIQLSKFYKIIKLENKNKKDIIKNEYKIELQKEEWKKILQELF